jgi:hypothetical protein
LTRANIIAQGQLFCGERAKYPAFDTLLLLTVVIIDSN